MARKKKKEIIPDYIIPIAQNRRARHDYSIEETFECGLSLQGTEVKSLRDKNVMFGDAYAILKNGEAFIIGLKISAFSHGNIHNHEPDRSRKLLLRKEQIAKLEKQVEAKGKTLVPLKLYFKKGWAKVLIGVATGKKEYDRREEIKARDAKRDIQRAMRSDKY